MNLIENKKIFHISSADRISGTSSNFKFKVNLNINDNFDKVVCLSAQIPKSYYSIRTGKNTFTLAIDNGFSYDVYIITIPIGNYNRRSLAVALQTALNAQLIPFGYSPFTVSYTTGINSADTGKYTFTYDNIQNPTSNIYFSFTDNVYYSLGFNKNSDNYFIYNGGTDKWVLESTNIIDLQLENVIFVCTDIIEPNPDNRLCDIYTSGEPTFSNILYTCVDLEGCSQNMAKSSNNIFTIYITDELSNPIDLNGLDINLTIMCYKSTNWFLKKLNSFLNLLTLKA